MIDISQINNSSHIHHQPQNQSNMHSAKAFNALIYQQ